MAYKANANLPSYVVNFDELVDAIGNYLKDGIKVDIGDMILNTEDIENLLEDIKSKIGTVDYSDLINALNDLGAKLDGLSSSLGISGTQKIYGRKLEIPAIAGKHKIEFKLPASGKITGITYSQSSWRFEDSWDLIAKGEKLFDGVRTKEFGEHKHFNVFYPINSGQTIEFIFNNNSSTSKVLWVDFSILEGPNNIIPPHHQTPNPTPSDPNTKNKNFRFLAIGESIYNIQGATNLEGCVYDADNMSDLFRQHKQSNKFVKNIVAKNTTKEESLNLIKNTFKDSKDEDINYLFWSGHGTIFRDKFTLVTKDNILTIDELQQILDNVKGTKIIMLDTCHSGKAIDKDFKLKLDNFKKFIEEKNLNVNIEQAVNKKALRLMDKSLKALNKEFNKDNYKVLAACAGAETSKDLPPAFNGNQNYTGAFTWALTQSIRNQSADTDHNKIITLQELYESVLHFYDEFNAHCNVQIEQKAQVYPINDSMPIFEYTGGN